MKTVVKKFRHLDDLHFEHQLWKSEANFFKDELKIYEKRLGEVALKNTKLEVRKQIEHFQNQFLIQAEQLHTLNHHVKVHELLLAKYAKENAATADKSWLPDHMEMHDKMETFRKLYAELKVEFNHFLSVWM